jgi:hypothetical protein
MTPATSWELIVAHLKQPEYVHVLLNPLPIYGLALGGLALVLGMVMKSRPAQITALVLIFIGAGSAIPVVHYGDAGYDAIESQMPNDQADAWLDAHGQRALRALPAYDALAVLALVALAVPWKWPKSRAILNGLTLAMTAFDFALGGWIGYAGGQAMHKEFRTGTPLEQVGGYDKMR